MVRNALTDSFTELSAQRNAFATLSGPSARVEDCLPAADDLASRRHLHPRLAYGRRLAVRQHSRREVAPAVGEGGEDPGIPLAFANSRWYLPHGDGGW